MTSDRILWNQREADGSLGCVDEIVLHDVKSVHVEQMNEYHWWIGIDLPDDSYWSGDFIVDGTGHGMRFVQQESTIVWGSDSSHEESKLKEVASKNDKQISYVSLPETENDVVRMLKERAVGCGDPAEVSVLVGATEEIERLRAESDELLEALRAAHADTVELRTKLFEIEGK